MRRVAVIGRPTEGNVGLVDGLRAQGLWSSLLSPQQAIDTLRRDDVAIARLDVMPTLDGVEPGLSALSALQLRGVRVVNRPPALLRAHDKLLTARRLQAAGVPHPRTQHVIGEAEALALSPPVVLKPRFGSWGKDVRLCRTRSELELCVRELRARRWFRRHGVLAQEALPIPERDLRLVVAGGVVVGAASRIAAPGEWRTNASLGARLEPASPPPEACTLGLAAAAAIEADLVGIDLFPSQHDGLVVLELNGAVEFDGRYSLAGRDVYADVALALGLTAARLEAIPA